MPNAVTLIPAAVPKTAVNHIESRIAHETDCWDGHRALREEMRGLALHAEATGHDRFCWFVLNDNSRAQAFYRGLGAIADLQWRRWMLPPAALSVLIRDSSLCRQQSRVVSGQ